MIINACGRICNECETYEVNCQGCYSHRREAPVEKEEGMCPIYECVMEKFPESRSCSSCPDLPCPRYGQCIDMNFSDKEIRKDILSRVARLRAL
ncbi:MAG: DUF3795 domain-containing protein [Spirochaetales bacterium]|nr:DUF3795 domain-containing protein [Spirochaetales bacterium]